MKLSDITFDKSAKNRILDMLGKAINEEGFIVEKNNPTQRVLTSNGEEILADEWAGIRKGSTIFLKSDSFSLIELAKQL